jgi:ankyrin repeat protein
VNATTKQGDSALLWAAKAGHGNLVELLLRNGADATLRNNRNEVALELAANDEVSALISACEYD